MKNQFRARIEVECKRRGWTLGELAKRLGKSPQTLNALLRRGDPKHSTTMEICKALDMTWLDFQANVTPAEYGEAMMRDKPA